MGRRAGCTLGDPGGRCALLPHPNTAHLPLWTTVEDTSEMPTFSERVRGLYPQAVRQVTRNGPAEEGPGKRRLCLKTPTTPCGPADFSREAKSQTSLRRRPLFKSWPLFQFFTVPCGSNICHLWLMPLDAPTGQGPSGDEHSVSRSSEFTESLRIPRHLSLGDHGPLFTAVETEALRERVLGEARP